MYRQVADHAVKIKNHPWPQGLGLAVDGHHIVTGPSGATRDIYLKSVIENLQKDLQNGKNRDGYLDSFIRRTYAQPVRWNFVWSTIRNH